MRGRVDVKAKVKDMRCTATLIPTGLEDGKVKVKAARCTATWMYAGACGL